MPDRRKARSTDTGSFPQKHNMNNLFKNLTSLFLILGALTFTACGDDDNGINYGGKDNSSSGTITPSSDITSRMETPATLTDGSTVTLAHYTTSGGRKVLTYSLEYVKSLYHSRWVAFRFDGDTRAKNTSRSDEPFTDDPDLSSSLRIGNNGFGWDYNRGHLCASADRLYNSEANQQTFYMSNMSPQLASFNQGYWITLENLVQRKGRDASFADTLYVVKGGSTKSGLVKDYVTRPNGAKVAIPSYYFMALLKVKNGVYSSIGFWLEHKEYGYTYNNNAPLSVIKEQAVSINRLEELTGIDFFPNLPDSQEETIESQNLPSNWGM